MQRKPPERADSASADPAGRPRLAGTSVITDLDAAWATAASGARLRAVQVAGSGLRHRFAAGPRAVAVRTLPLVVLPYPTKYAFFGAAMSVAPYVLLSHRCLVVQFLQGGALKTLLYNPTEPAGARSTPFFARLAGGVPRRLRSLFAHEAAPLVEQLHELGLEPDDIDYVAFDNLHAQDLRPLLGEPGASPRFPRATVVVSRVEWDEWADPHPLQRSWFVRPAAPIPRANGARAGADRVALTSGDLMLGDGVMLLRTPGRTAGNQTLFINTSSGVWGASANGSAADSWSPLESKIPGLRSSTRKHDLEVLLSTKTPDRAPDEYTSMVLEKTIVDRLKRAPAFAQMFPTSEVTPSVLSPGLKPTVLQRAITHGEVIRPARAEVRAAGPEDDDRRRRTTAA